MGNTIKLKNKKTGKKVTIKTPPKPNYKRSWRIASTKR